MTYYKEHILKNGKTAILRNATYSDGEAALENFNLTHAETDFLLSYPDENDITVADEGEYLAKKTESENEIEIIAIVDGQLVATAGIDAVGTKHKLKHRAEFGVSVAKEFWGNGIGTALTKACVECAKRAGYTQLELSVVAENEGAVSVYKKAGFIEFGRDPRGFNSRLSGYQELVYMRLELD